MQSSTDNAKQSIDIDMVSGATANTRAFQKAVENAIIGRRLMSKGAPQQGQISTVGESWSSVMGTVA